jgi:UDP-D-galactose:(glucosyl)LPS alpha-1,6-D-galactosyltransferase
VVTHLMNGLVREGDDCRLYIFGGSAHKAWLQRVPWSLEIGGSSQPRPVRLLNYLFRGASQLRAWRPDIIVCCDTTTVRIARWCLKLAGLRNIPVVCWLHCSYRFLRMQNEVARADANLCICLERAEEVRELLRKTGDRATQRKPVFLMYSGTPEGVNPAIRRAAVPTFVFAGRIQYEPGKRIKDLIEASARIKGDFRIKLLGDGSEAAKEKIRKRASELGIERKIEWLGWHADSWSAVDEASAMVLPSDAEGFSMVTIEALARGLPAIIADFGGIAREAVLEGQTGWIFPVADVAALAAILQRIVDDPAILPDAESIRQFARKFSTEQMVADFRRAMRTLLEKSDAAN